MRYYFSFYMQDGSRPVSVWTQDTALAERVRTTTYKQNSSCYFMGPFRFADDAGGVEYRVDMTKVLMFGTWEEEG